MIGAMPRKLIPLPGLTEDQTRSLSRQQRYKLRRAASGLCSSCGKAPIATGLKDHCVDCASTQRERMRVLSGATRRNVAAKSYQADAPARGGGTKKRGRPRKQQPAEDTRDFT